MGKGTVAVGTTNAGKCLAVKQALSAYFHLDKYGFQSYKVASGVADQPVTLKETLRGAKNRAHKALEASDGAASLGIGLESGLFEDPDGRLCDLTACCIFDGEQDHVGYSCAWALPESCSRRVREAGMDLSQAANASGLCNDPKIGEKGGLIGVLTGGRVTRPQYTIQSIQMALLTMNPEHYQCNDKSISPGINRSIDEKNISCGKNVEYVTAYRDGFVHGTAIALAVTATAAFTVFACRRG